MVMQEFDYPLPDDAIAQTPVEPRDAARLLVALDAAGTVEHRRVADLPDLLGPGDLLVVNESRVLPARLRLRKPSGGAVEVLLLEEGSDGWEALVRPGRRVPPGTRLQGTSGLAVEVGDRLDGGRRRVRLHAEHGDESQALAAEGTVPLPPYIRAPLADPERYQTVYASRPGSVAAPTAGLHLTHDVLERCREREVEVASVDLSVSLDTFRPITAERPEDHRMHSERYRVPPETLEACSRARRVVAVGTTTTRALESAARGQREGRTSLFIHGDFRFRVVDLLLTNFHLPRSSLLLLLAAFVGPCWRDLYACALAEGYRFLSFGDALLVARRPVR
jgi:S-adenosylmethionine:tRNA ribosyltransferase-isomerase